ncbi:hypothetical protein Salat_0493700 [Sesamum alatum]|uniref:Cotton fiber protein n=1 Tax=Sesamum alatum TaxID=300844 RepID=A0AAE2D0R4_9LAMI|nr:hypothetical protein Salat_0493700 [Sesamum alatum]
MSFLNLKRLLAPKKVWKVFKNKLPLKLNRSKAIKKPKNPSYKTSRRLGWPSLSIQPKKFKIKPNPRPLIHHRNNHYYFQKNASPSPVFVDQLFIGMASTTTKEHVHPASETVEEAVTKKEKSCSSTALKQSGSFDKKNDMWESLVLASPQMHDEINERAEEFIARFRAEMQNQETLARRL